MRSRGHDPLDRHRLSTDELTALAGGTGSRSTIESLRRARLSRQKLLIEAARRTGGDGCAEAWDLLGQVTAVSAEVVDDVLSLPQAGAWAFDALQADTPDSGYLNALAVVAAMRAAERFEIDVPLREGKRSFPGLGTLRASREVGAARLTDDGRGGLSHDTGSWSETPVVEVGSAPALTVAFEADDPYLARYGMPPRRPDPAEFGRWRALLEEAWQIIVEYDSDLAADLAIDLQVIVPLEREPGHGPMSATSGWASGAIALGMPDDALWLAETLIHEYRHCLLGIVEDIVPLVDPAADTDPSRLCYAPWRDDPRPPSGVLHGCFAHLSIAGFWRWRGRHGPADGRPQAQHHFARWRSATAVAVGELLGSHALTAEGACLAKAMRDTLEVWRNEPIDLQAGEEADHDNALHLMRWRLSHLLPDEHAVAALAEDFTAGAPPRSAPVTVQLAAGNSSTARADAWLTWPALALATVPRIRDRIEVAYAVFDRLHRVGEAAVEAGAVLRWVATGVFAVVQKR